MRAPLVNVNLVNDEATRILSLQAAFRTGAPIRGVPQAYKPTFWAKVKLVFDKSFKIMAGGVPIEGASRWMKFRAIFDLKFQLKKAGRILGRGFFEADCIKMGYSKRELEKLVEDGLLRKVYTSYQGAHRTTYVCLMEVEGVE